MASDLQVYLDKLGIGPRIQKVAFWVALLATPASVIFGAWWNWHVWNSYDVRLKNQELEQGKAKAKIDAFDIELRPLQITETQKSIDQADASKHLATLETVIKSLEAQIAPLKTSVEALTLSKTQLEIRHFTDPRLDITADLQGVIQGHKSGDHKFSYLVLGVIRIKNTMPVPVTIRFADVCISRCDDLTPLFDSTKFAAINGPETQGLVNWNRLRAYTFKENDFDMDFKGLLDAKEYKDRHPKKADGEVDLLGTIYPNATGQWKCAFITNTSGIQGFSMYATLFCSYDDENSQPQNFTQKIQALHLLMGNENER